MSLMSKSNLQGLIADLMAYADGHDDLDVSKTLRDAAEQIVELAAELGQARADAGDLQRALDEGQLAWAEAREGVEPDGEQGPDGDPGEDGAEATFIASAGWGAPKSQVYSVGGLLPNFTVKRGGVVYEHTGIADLDVL